MYRKFTIRITKNINVNSTIVAFENETIVYVDQNKIGFIGNVFFSFFIKYVSDVLYF